MRTKTCVYCGNTIDYNKKFGRGFKALLLQIFAKDIKSCHNCDKFMVDVIQHNAKVSYLIFQRNKEKFYSSFKDGDTLFIVPPIDTSIISNLFDAPIKVNKKKEKKYKDYIG